MSGRPVPLVVQYLYLHEDDEGFHYPTVRAEPSARGVAARYLECAIAQAASLRLQDAACDLALATNIEDPHVLGREGAELLRTLESLGVELLATEYVHRPIAGTHFYVSSRYVLDAILSATATQDAERVLWLTDVDCIWADPGLVFESAPAASEVGCIHMGYSPTWDAVGHGQDGRTRVAIGEMAVKHGGSGPVPPWIGGELLCGTPAVLRELVGACEELDVALGEADESLPNEEQILTLAGAAGRVAFRDLSHVAGRVPTGPRNHATPVDDPLSIGLWHLPSEKGLSLRRAAEDVRRGRTAALRRDLADSRRAARRFNVAGTGLWRRLRDDGWLAVQLLRQAGGSMVARRRGNLGSS